MARRKTMADLAEAADVSLSTIDRILSGRGPVKRMTLEHVLETAEEIGFHATGTIRARLTQDSPERVFGFLLNPDSRHLYTRLAQDLIRATEQSPVIRGQAIVRHLARIDPEETAAALRELGSRCHAITAVMMDHPLINLAVADLARQGVPVLALMSDISAPERAGFLGASDWKLGRTAGWFMRRLRPEGGKVAVLVGSGSYLCQRAHEMGFRQYLADHGCPHQLLPSRLTGEEDRTAREEMIRQISETPDLAGVMVAGGGLDGVVAAVRERKRGDLTVIGTEMTDATRPALLDGTVDVILCHPSLALVDRTIEGMIIALDRPGSGPLHHIVPFEIAVSESV
ncbi:LacI family DNA-binding transcriptional regulator [Frigidibacter sp. MR17.14]|uniref:LacI family DNA-binding transcriptional regulator n=1 Tax=Frigidibacter sp. MR17.14 TaxID=3126509 RepID=UPI0030130A3F